MIRSSQRRTAAAQDNIRSELLASLNSTRVQIAQAYGGFNTASDRDLVDFYIYEIKALQARYDYLLRQVKSMERPS